MTSKSNKKDYKTLYDALKTEHNFVLKKSSDVLKDALNRLKSKDNELAKVKAQLKSKSDELNDANREIHLSSNCAKYFKKQFKIKEEELAKYKEAEKAYKIKFSLEETRLTSQEMKETERRAREDESDESEEDLVGNGLYGFCKECKICLVEDDDDRGTGNCEECDDEIADNEEEENGFCDKCGNGMDDEEIEVGTGHCSECTDLEVSNNMTCGRNCKPTLDVRWCCEYNCSKKNTNMQFFNCPQKIATICFTLGNDPELYKKLEEGDWSYIKEYFNLNIKELEELKDMKTKEDEDN